MKFAVLLFLLSGCGLMQPQTNMSAEQLLAASKDKNASSVCTKVVAPGWTGVVVVGNIDKGVGKQGSVTVDDNCKTTITASDAPK